jgi:photosystem II stability/assembly factor-like uncharacterized protein
MGQGFSHRPHWFRRALVFLIIGLVVAAYQAIFTFSFQRALSATSVVTSGHPAENQAFRRLRQQDANGVIPPDGPSKAAQQIKAMLAVGPSAASAWTAIGPGNVGGRVRSIVIHPTNPNTMWLGSVTGGVWKTTNGGASWQPLDDSMKSLAVSTLIISPLDANVLYAGTGDSFGDSTGDGIFKTTNGGTTWTQLATTTCKDRSTFDFRWCGINRLVIALNGQTILAATTKGIERSTDGGATWMPQPILGNIVMQDINFSPNDSTKVIASGVDAATGLGAAWYSTDSGATWQPAVFSPALSGAGRIEIAYARSNPAIVYALVDRNNGEIWKSIDGGHSYTQVSIEVWQTPDPHHPAPRGRLVYQWPLG